MKAAAHMRPNAGSFKGVKNSMMTSFRGLGGSLDLTVRFAITCSPRIMNAAARMVQGKPILGMSFETKIGRITPPQL